MYFGLDEMMSKLKKYMMSNKISFSIKGSRFFYNPTINAKQTYLAFAKV